MTGYDDIFDVAKESAAALDPMFARKGKDAIGLTAEIDAMDWRNSKTLQEVDDPVMREEIANSLIASRAARREAAAKYELGEALKWSREEFTNRFARNAAENTADMGRALDLADAQQGNAPLTEEQAKMQNASFCAQFSEAAMRMFAEHHAGMKKLGFSDAESLAASEVAMNKYVKGVLAGFGESASPTKQRVATAALEMFGRPEARYDDLKDDKGNVVKDKDGNPVKDPNTFDPGRGLWLTDDDANDLRKAFEKAKSDRMKAVAAADSAKKKQFAAVREAIAGDAEATAFRMYDEAYNPETGKVSSVDDIMKERRRLVAMASTLRAVAPAEYVKAMNAIDSAFNSASARQKALDNAVVNEKGAESYDKAMKMVEEIEKKKAKTVRLPFVDENGKIAYENVDAAKARLYILERVRHMAGIPDERKDELKKRIESARKDIDIAKFATEILGQSISSDDGEGYIDVIGGGKKLRLTGANTYLNRNEQGLEYNYKNSDGKPGKLTILPQFLGTILDAIQDYHDRCTIPNAEELREIMDRAAEVAAKQSGDQMKMNEFAKAVTYGIDDLFKYRKKDGFGRAKVDFRNVRSYILDDRSSDRGILKLGNFKINDDASNEASQTINGFIRSHYER